MIVSANPSINLYIDQGKVPSKYLKEDSEPIRQLFRKNGFSEKFKFMFDRTESIPHYLNVTNTHPLSSATIPLNLTFEQHVENRCKELLSYGKKINVSWSGGIDSTLVLFALRHYATDKNQVQVYGTYNSILESGYVFDRYIKNTMRYDITTNPLGKDLYNCPDDEIFVTGNMGNQLFYFDTIHSKTRDSCLQFKESTSDLSSLISKYADSPYEDALTESNCEFLYPAIKNSPRKITTLQDLRWFICFNFTWNSVYYSPHNERATDTHDNIYAFYATDNFQNWSITNTDQPTKIGDYTDERWQSRQLISEFMGDKKYPFAKKNTLSILAKYNKDWLFLLDDYSKVYYQQ